MPKIIPSVEVHEPVVRYYANRNVVECVVTRHYKGGTTTNAKHITARCSTELAALTLAAELQISADKARENV